MEQLENLKDYEDVKGEYLTEKQKEALEIYLSEDKTFSTVSEIMDIGQSTARQHVLVASQKIKEVQEFSEEIEA